jgi:hypothetical protein
MFPLGNPRNSSQLAGVVPDLACRILIRIPLEVLTIKTKGDFSAYPKKLLDP